MKNTFKALILMGLSATAYGFDGGALPVGEDEQYCFGKAMVGMDSVINSRLGVPAEHALDLAVLPYVKTGALDQRVYSRNLLRVILNAYLWEESPHSYAVKVFYNCAANTDGAGRDGSSDYVYVQ